jgi:peptide chain release factor 1
LIETTFFSYLREKFQKLIFNYKIVLEKLAAIKRRWEEVEQKLSDPKVIGDMKEFKKFNKEYKDLTAVVNAYHEYKNVVDNIEYNKNVFANEKDEELKEMAKMDMEELFPKKEKMEEEIRQMLVPKDPEDAKNCVIEIRAGTGGDEASIFAGDLFRMYSRFCDNKGLKLEVIDFNDGTAGGYKEVICEVTGENAYGILKFESGVHRVQRVPLTETMGRVHTSAATVIVMP